MTAEPMTDLAERVALALGWKPCKMPFPPHPCPTGWVNPGKGHVMPPKLDVTILPALWADMKARGWDLELIVKSQWEEQYRYRVVIHTTGRTVGRRMADPVVALCEAFVAAVEAEDGT